MNTKILLAFIFVLVVALSIGTISASDVNETDSHINQIDDTSIDAPTDESPNPIEKQTQDSTVDVSQDNNDESHIDKDASNDVLKSDISSSLSTNTDKEILSSEKSSTVSLSAAKTITAKDVTKYYKGNAKYSAKFLDFNGTPLVNTNVKIIVKGVTYKVKTDNKGIATLDINLKPGAYKVIATNPVTGYKKTSTFKILSTIVAKDISKVRQDSRKFTAKFYKKNGKALAKKYIKFKVHGKVYNVKTSAKGVAKLSLINLKPGTYKIISYNPDGLKVKNKIKVYKRAGTSLVSKRYSFYQSSNNVIKVRLLNKFGYAPNKGKIIKFKVNGKTYSSKTNKNGYASFKLPNLKIGTFTVKYKFAGNGYYKASSATNKVIIKKAKNPYGTKKAVVYLNMDSINGYSKDMKVLKNIAKLLGNAGWKTKICGIGSSSHYDDRGQVKNGIWFCIYGGACASTLKETANNEWFRKPLVNHGSRTVVGFLPPSGDIRKGGKYYEWLPRAWDDDFSDKNFKGLEYPADYLTDHAIPFMYANTAKQMVSKFLAGGDNKEACTKNWKFYSKTTTIKSSIQTIQKSSLLAGGIDNSLGMLFKADPVKNEICMFNLLDELVNNDSLTSASIQLKIDI